MALMKERGERRRMKGGEEERRRVLVASSGTDGAGVTVTANVDEIRN